MLGLINLGKSFGARTLFEGVSLNLVPGARYGLVGANGSGKTTLLKILAGDEPSDGKVTFAQNLRLGVLRQDRFLDDTQLIIEVAKAGDEVVTGALAEQAALLGAGEVNSERLLELEDRIAAHDGYTLQSRAASILEGLGIPVSRHGLPLGTLSGGFKLRVLLAQVLIGRPDVLLLDEPTNHLDILSIRWLETFLSDYEGLALVISHDQRFLDNVATHVLDVDYGTVSLYTGNYAAFVTQKAETRARKEAEIARAEAIIAEKRAFVERFGAKATKARQAQSRLKQIERIEVEEIEQTSRRAPLFRFDEERPSGRDVLALDGISKSYAENAVLRAVSLKVRRQERVAIIGPNGLGKSTLLKIAVGSLASDAGSVTWGYEARVGYFAQDHREVLERPDATPYEVIDAAIPTEPPNVVRGHLGRLLFSGDDVYKPVAALSGGEAARLVFCRLIVQRPNVLVLDEPTNHLDLESIEALVEALRAFPGTLLLVSHDRAFVSALATRILEVTEHGFQDFPGTYQEYLERCGDDHLDASAALQRAKERGAEAEVARPERADAWEAKKRKNNRQKELPKLRDRALQAVEAAEARKAAITAMWCEPGFFERTSAEEVARLQAEERELGPRIEALLAEWEALEAELMAT